MINRIDNYIGDLVRREDFNPDCFNLIDAGPGTGKTTFVNERLHELFPEIPYRNIFMAESRSLTASMLDKSDSNFSMMHQNDIETKGRLMGLPDLNDDSVNSDIVVATYDKLVDMVAHNNGEGDILAGVDIIILDEVHCLYADTFIGDIKAVSVWLKGLFSPDRIKRPLVIGLTATPDCFIRLNGVEQNLPIHRVLDRKLVKYQAQHLICGLMTDIPAMCKTRFRGKTLIMCEKLEDCYALARILGNAAVVCSSRNENITEEMIRIRRHIEEEATLPDTYLNEVTRRWEPLKYLIMTSTGREGYNFVPKYASGNLMVDDIQNVVVCFTDPMSIVQFAGRPRYNVPNLMVAMNPFGQRGVNTNSFRWYQYINRESYKEFVTSDDRRGNPWFRLMSPFIQERIDDIEVLPSVRLSPKVQQTEMRKMRSDSLVGELIQEIGRYISDESHEVRIYEADEKQIIDAAENVGLLDNGKYTFKRVLNILKRNGFSVDCKDDRNWVNKKNQHKTYHIIRRNEDNEKGTQAT